VPCDDTEEALQALASGFDDLIGKLIHEDFAWEHPLLEKLWRPSWTSKNNPTPWPVPCCQLDQSDGKLQ
jgi:hypothetical protein